MTAKNQQSWQVLNFLFITIGLLKKEFKETFNLQKLVLKKGDIQDRK
jgi:hypothetical protein